MLIYTHHLVNAFLLSVVLILLLKKPAAALGLIDTPAGRKMHEGSIPVVGGLAIFIAFVWGGMLLVGPMHIPLHLLCGLSLLVLVGVLDDRFDLPALLRLFAQAIAAIIMLLPDRHVVQFVSLVKLAPVDLGYWAFPLTWLFVVGMVNAYNMLDGLDGLAGGASAVALFWLSIGFIGYPEQPLLLILLCAVLGFLVFNMRHPWRSRATVFLGDAGSTMLGAAIAFYIILRSGTHVSHEGSFVSYLWIAAIPIIDTLSLIVRRLAAGHNPLSGDRNHLHHLLLGIGVSHRCAAALIVAACFVTGGIGTVSARFGASGGTMLLALVVPAALHTAFILHLSRRISERIGMPAESTEVNGA